LSSKADFKGVHVSRTLGVNEFAELWDSIHVEPDLKESLLCQALLNFTLRSKVSRTVIPLHGVISHYAVVRIVNDQGLRRAREVLLLP
jgi:hypothetical protein